MTMLYHDTSEGQYNRLLHLCHGYIRNFRAHRYVNATKTAEAQNSAYRNGMLDCFKLALAVELSSWRADMYDKWRMLPLVENYDSRLVRFAEELPEKHVELMHELAAIKDHDDKQARQAEFDQWINETCAEIAFDEKLQETELQRHRSAVLAKTEEPTDADRPWLEKMFNMQRSQMEELQKILGTDQV